MDVCARTNTSFTLEVRRIIQDSPQDILGTRTLTRYDELLLSKGATTVRTTKATQTGHIPNAEEFPEDWELYTVGNVEKTVTDQCKGDDGYTDGTLSKEGIARCSLGCPEERSTQSRWQADLLQR